MNSMKRIVALFLAVVMTMAMTLTAFAAQDDGVMPLTDLTGTTGKLTVGFKSGSNQNSLKNQTINIYKLFDLNSISEQSGQNDKYAYTLNVQYKQALISALELESGATEKDILDELNRMQSNSGEINGFAEKFSQYVLEEEIDATKTSGKIVGEIKEYTFTDVESGYYLVYQTGTVKLQSSLITVIGSKDGQRETKVDLKGDAPSIDKTVEDNVGSVEIGDVLTYHITGIIPDTTGYEQYQYIIHDTLTGLDFVKDKNGTALTGDEKLPVKVTIGDEEPFDVTEEQEATVNGSEMTLDLSSFVTSYQIYKGKKLTITYYAKVRKDANVGTKNSAKLEYGNQPGETTPTVPDEVKTPTYPIRINKIIAGGSTQLDGATFRIYKSADAVSTAAIKVEYSSEGKYIVAENQMTGNMDITSSLTDLGGYNLEINGLAAGTYWIEEISAPDGYNKLNGRIKVTITKSTTNDEAKWTMTKGDTNDVVTDKIIVVENSTGTILPGTGGMGTIVFTVVAVVLIAGVAVSFIISRRKEA